MQECADTDGKLASRAEESREILVFMQCPQYNAEDLTRGSFGLRAF
jgi:hypothetical protein